MNQRVSTGTSEKPNRNNPLTIPLYYESLLCSSTHKNYCYRRIYSVPSTDIKRLLLMFRRKYCVVSEQSPINRPDLNPASTPRQESASPSLLRFGPYLSQD